MSGDWKDMKRLARSCTQGAEMDFSILVEKIQTTTDALVQDVLVVINRNVTVRAWLTGLYIVEYEQNGSDRAKYGEGLLKALSDRLGRTKFSVPALKKFRQFYRTFPQLAGPIASYLADRFGNGYSPIVQLPETKEANGYSPIIQSGEDVLVVSPSGTPIVSPWHLFNRLSYTHLAELLPLGDDLQRTFYAFEAIVGTWSVRELRRQVESRYYERCGWSGNPAELSRRTRAKASKMDIRSFVKTNTVLEFLDLKPTDVWDEKELEGGILDHLQDFILEMGTGFCFEARQKKILVDDAYEKVDLVFYHRILKCHVLIELKAKKFDYADAAQLSVYMAYYRKHVMQPDDNPPVGILLCTEIGHEMVEYVETFVDPNLFVSKYRLQLPPKEKIVEFLKRENAAANGGAE